MSRPADEVLPAEALPAEPVPVEVPPVEKPDGFDIRDRLSSKWKPKDAVYQASQDIVAPESLFVCWIEGGEIRFHSSGSNVAALIVGALGAYMGWR